MVTESSLRPLQWTKAKPLKAEAPPHPAPLGGAIGLAANAVLRDPKHESDEAWSAAAFARSIDLVRQALHAPNYSSAKQASFEEFRLLFFDVRRVRDSRPDRDRVVRELHEAIAARFGAGWKQGLETGMRLLDAAGARLETEVAPNRRVVKGSDELELRCAERFNRGVVDHNWGYLGIQIAMVEDVTLAAGVLDAIEDDLSGAPRHVYVAASIGAGLRKRGRAHCWMEMVRELDANAATRPGAIALLFDAIAELDCRRPDVESLVANLTLDGLSSAMLQGLLSALRPCAEPKQFATFEREVQRRLRSIYTPSHA